MYGKINNPRECYKQAFKEGLINDIEICNDILLSRNATAQFIFIRPSLRPRCKIWKYMTSEL
ncbi:nucleotidyltransferase substrate binding protein [Clostridium tagluense]|uniref:nucleotidyltransferase substrate binding protein n=1 Tax=Clostridium tagluense TaxID=360422 RepID=UPI001CF3AD7B|nr:nucleotidyltransferase substrate binding protein [Clostridium tagluense]MCB2321592.1 nucleotidyltransferase substrate binding protein [Clostridium tagluense]MCB2338067.1 nucleotidyltransferase substrate binding protein [Clostridium tagluense]MCB2364982.1 nucleotidyltransferase substrate binding protein [Clostridium tagluense]